MSRALGNGHARFLRGSGAAMRPTYLTTASTWRPTAAELAQRRARVTLQNSPSRRSRRARLLLLGELASQKLPDIAEMPTSASQKAITRCPRRASQAPVPGPDARLPLIPCVPSLRLQRLLLGECGCPSEDLGVPWSGLSAARLRWNPEKAQQVPIVRDSVVGHAVLVFLGPLV